jgi:hypothetical protein
MYKVIISQLGKKISQAHKCYEKNFSFFVFRSLIGIDDDFCCVCLCYSV